MGLLDSAGILLYLSVGAAAMGTEWEQIIAMARELDLAASAGRGLDLDRIRELARLVLAFQKSRHGGNDDAHSVDPGRAAR
jgi:hypothetical protein